MKPGRLLYLFCITDRQPVLDKLSGLGNAVSCVCSDGMYAVISDVPEEDFAEEKLRDNISEPGWLEKNVRIHNDVINKTMSWGETVVIPFKFATVFFDEDSLASFLKKYSDTLKKNIDLLRNKEEWGIKIFCERKDLERYILANNPDIKAIDANIEASSPGKAYFIRKKKAEMLSSLVMGKTSEYAKTCYQNLEKLSVKAKINQVQPRELTGKSIDMILNAVFLVERSEIAEFTNVILDLRNMYGSRGLLIECTGPWPAYNFCDIEQK